MTTIQTLSGSFTPFDPKPEDIHIEDIARSLANTCRWGGHMRQFYSVAEHSVMVACQCSDENQLWGLLHDAAEAYVGDIVAPLKDRTFAAVGPGYRFQRFEDVENGILDVILQKAGLPSHRKMPEEVHQADMTIREWELRNVVQPAQDVVFTPMTPDEAFDKWMHFYDHFTSVHTISPSLSLSLSSTDSRGTLPLS